MKAIAIHRTVERDYLNLVRRFPFARFVPGPNIGRRWPLWLNCRLKGMMP